MNRPIIGYDTTCVELKLLAETIWGFKVKAKGAKERFMRPRCIIQLFGLGSRTAPQLTCLQE